MSEILQNTLGTSCRNSGSRRLDGNGTDRLYLDITSLLRLSRVYDAVYLTSPSSTPPEQQGTL